MRTALRPRIATLCHEALFRVSIAVMLAQSAPTSIAAEQSPTSLANVNARRPSVILAEVSRRRPGEDGTAEESKASEEQKREDSDAAEGRLRPGTKPVPPPPEGTEIP